jgi:type II secretory ATPase GspE/PulE/Tfp pilus assembly ATPase PilB-like protein
MELGLPYVDLEQLTPDDSILAKIPRNVARRNTILPLFVDDDMLLVACVDEPTHDLEDELRLRVGVPMRRLIASPLSINQAIAKFYSGLEADGESESTVEGSAKQKTARKKAKTKAKTKAQTAATPDPGSSEAMAAEHKRRQIGMILMCWSVIVPVMLDLLVLPSSVKVFDIFGFSLSLVASPILIFVVWKSFFRRS